MEALCLSNLNLSLVFVTFNDFRGFNGAIKFNINELLDEHTEFLRSMILTTMSYMYMHFNK